MTFSTPFAYDPLSGDDLCIEVLTDGFQASGSGALVDFTLTGSKCSRLWDLTFAPTGVTANVQTGRSSPLRLTFAPAPGLWAAFTKDVTSGNTPLTAQFADASQFVVCCRRLAPECVGLRGVGQHHPCNRH